MNNGFQFKIEKKLKKGLGRAGIVHTPHSIIETPAFSAVGTKATVKAITPAQLKELGAQVVLANTYHLYLEPGEQVLKGAGGLGKFMGWAGPTMTDSGGFQVFSLGANFDKKVGKIVNVKISDRTKIYSQILENLRIDSKVGEEVEVGVKVPLAKIDEDGVSFRSVIDGSAHRLTPERSIEIQQAIGADIIFAFDECASPDAPYEYQKEAMERTHRWATRCLGKQLEIKMENGKWKIEGGNTNEIRRQALFGIVQGGRFEDLRKASAKIIARMDFDGFGIGGSFEKRDIDTAVGWVNKILPEEKPRHLLGIGDPSDLFGAVENGCDLFDCVAPTRMARNGALYTKSGPINITNARFKNDFSKIDADCGCYSCLYFTRAYLAHLFRSGEILGATLASIHNLYFIISLVASMRQAILDGKFSELKSEFLGRWGN